MRNFIWWTIYVIVAVWLQKLIPGLDAMVPGLIICLQERNRQQTVIFLLICVILQEGAGTLPFGASIMWYGFVFVSFHVGGWFFMSRNQFFVLILSIALAFGRALLFTGMGELQTLPLDTQALAGHCLAQAVLTPLIWMLAGRSRRKRLLQPSGSTGINF